MSETITVAKTVAKSEAMNAYGLSSSEVEEILWQSGHGYWSVGLYSPRIRSVAQRALVRRGFLAYLAGGRYAVTERGADIVLFFEAVLSSRPSKAVPQNQGM